MSAKKRNKYGRGNLQLAPPEKVYIPNLRGERSHFHLADYIILAGLIKGDRAQREHIMSSIKSRESNYFNVKQFPYFLFQVITKWLGDDLNKKITPEMFLDQIYEFFPTVWDYQPKWREVRETMYVCCQFYYMEITPKDIDLAIGAWKNKPRQSWQSKTANQE